MTNKIDPVRKTDDEAIEMAHDLITNSRYIALAVRERETQVPLVSRVAGAWHPELGLFFAASDLSVHSQCLAVDSQCSVMIGEPGKGDGLAHPRITVIAHCNRMANDHERRQAFRDAFVKIHPKAELYIDFADFGFYPLRIERALLNGGFGKAYRLTQAELSFVSS